MIAAPEASLTLLRPLLGHWVSQPRGDASASRMPCTRSFARVWGGAYIRMEARWEMGDGKGFEEVAMFGKGRDGTLAFWSFTSDGKQSHGWLTDASDVHPNAVAFLAEMPAGTARMVYWPADDGGFDYAVEARTPNGWNRFLRHHYRPSGEANPRSA